MDLEAYFAGFVDGEGCFTVSFSPRSKLLIGREVRPSFSVSQNADRSEVLLLMQEHFGCGSIRPDRSDKTLKYEVRSLDDLVERIIPSSKLIHCYLASKEISNGSRTSANWCDLELIEARLGCEKSWRSRCDECFGKAQVHDRSDLPNRS